MSLKEDLDTAMDKVKLEIIEQREEIVRAFVAKYGFGPEEIEQILDMSDYENRIIRWSIRKKGGNDVRSGV